VRKCKILALLCSVSVLAAGCASKHIVSASTPSVSVPPQDETVRMPAPSAPPPVPTVTEEPPPEVESTVPPPVAGKRPAAPKRPATTESADSTPAKPAAPQISPQLSPRDLESTKKNTTANLMTAEQNLQLANGRQLSAAQKDLAEKITGFISQSHEAIRSDDWVRAQNLAEKARVLSTDLVKSF
jgi:hypothetical protein